MVSIIVLETKRFPNPKERDCISVRDLSKLIARHSLKFRRILCRSIDDHTQFSWATIHTQLLKTDTILKVHTSTST